jgi:hypothetical protein
MKFLVIAQDLRSFRDKPEGIVSRSFIESKLKGAHPIRL